MLVNAEVRRLAPELIGMVRFACRGATEPSAPVEPSLQAAVYYEAAASPR